MSDLTTTVGVMSEAQLQRRQMAIQQQEAEEKVRQQAAEATRQAEAQAEQVRQQSRAQAAEAQEKARAEALSRQATVRKAQGEAEREAEALKGGAREARRVELRKQDLPFTKPERSVVNIKNYVKSVESARVKAHREGRAERADIEKVKDDYVAEVDKQLQDAIGDIDRQALAIKGDIAKQLVESQASIARQVAVLLAGVDEWEADAIAQLKKAEADYNKLLADIAPYKVGDGYDLTAMVDAGYDTKTLATYGFSAEDIAQAQQVEVAAKLQPLAGLEVFTGMVASGEIPKNAVYVGSVSTADGLSIQYEVPTEVLMTAREQFDQWKATDPTAPKDAVFEGESSDGGFQYSSPSAMEVEVETAKGKVAMPVSEWDAMPDIKKYETVLGRAPTSNEWQAYRLLEAGVNLAWWKELIPGAPDFVGRLAKFIPGKQEEERYVDIKQVAIAEWVKAYPNLKGYAIGAGILEDLGFSAAKALYPQVAIKDVTGKEWAMTGLNVALWTLPAWLPKTVKGIKVLIPNKVTARLRTVPFSESAGLRKAPLPKVKVISPSEVGMGEGQFQRFIKARVNNPKLTPDTFKVIESIGTKLKRVVVPEVKRVATVTRRAKPSGLPNYGYPRRVGVPQISQAEWLKIWKPTKIQPTFPPTEIIPQGWVRTTGGKYMPAGVTAISLPDVPIGLMIRSPVITGTGKIVTPVKASQVVKSLGLTQEQIAGTKSLTSSQTNAASRVLGVTQAQVATIAKQGKLVQSIQQTIVSVRSMVQGLTNTKALVLQKLLTKLDTKPLTKTETQALAQTLNLTSTQTKTLLKSMTELKTTVQEATKTFEQVSTKVRVRTQTETKTRTKRRIRTGDGEDEVKHDKEGRPIYPDGSIVWLMGELQRGQEWKAILPPYTQNKPISSTKVPHGVKVTTGTPQQTLTFIGGKTPFRNVAFDLGITDGYIDVKHRIIEFTGGGLKTNVGKRIPSTTRGITLSNSSMIRRLPRGKARHKVSRQPSRMVVVG